MHVTEKAGRLERRRHHRDASIRGRLRFGLRSLLVLVLAVSVCCAWLRIRLNAVRREFEAEQESLAHIPDKTVTRIRLLPDMYSWCIPRSDWRYFDRTVTLEIDANRIDAALLEHIGALRSLRQISLRTYDPLNGVALKATDFRPIACLGHLEVLIMPELGVSDGAIEYLIASSALRHLDLAGNPISDKGLERLKQKHCEIEWLDLEATQITDAGVKTLLDLPCLTRLNLGGNAITDEAIRDLAALESLSEVWIWNTQVTPEGEARLKQLRPDVIVHGTVD